MNDYPDSISNSAIQPIDIGTSWGSIGLTIFYSLWGVGDLVNAFFKHKLVKYTKLISTLLYLLGFAFYLISYYLYNRRVKYLIVFLGLTGISYDWVLAEKIE